MARIPLIADIKGLSHETAMPRRFRGALKISQRAVALPHNLLKTPVAQEKRSYSAPKRQVAKARIVGSSSTP